MRTPLALVALGLLAGATEAQQHLAVDSALASYTPTAPTASAPAAGGWSMSLYKYDDDTGESGYGLNTAGDIAWFHMFDSASQGGGDTIVSVNTAFGHPASSGLPPTGTPVIVGVWEDPNDDGNPNDLVLVSQGPATVMNEKTNIINPFPVPPASVTGIFFVGAIVPIDANQFPAPRDTLVASLGRAWLGYNLGKNTYNVMSPQSNPSLVDVDSLSTSNVWLLTADGTGPGYGTYCAAKVNSLGCTAQMNGSGVPSASLGSGFTVSSINVRNNKSGLLFYTVNGAQASVVFQCGTLCVGPSGIKRTPAQSAGGNPNPTNDCSGIFSIDMNAFGVGALGGNPSPGLGVAGNMIQAQFWGRDQGFPSPCNTTLTDAIEYVLAP